MVEGLPEARERVCPCCNGVGAVPVRVYEALVAPGGADLDTVLRLVYSTLAEMDRARSLQRMQHLVAEFMRTLEALGYRGLDYTPDA